MNNLRDQINHVNLKSCWQDFKVNWQQMDYSQIAEAAAAPNSFLFSEFPSAADLLD